MDSPDQQGQQHPGQQSFHTDEDLDRRLEMMENFLAHLCEGLPAAQREMAALRRDIFPKLQRAA